MSGQDRPHVLVLNHFAVSRDSAGGTRHVELFGRMENWRHTIIAANRNLFDRKKYTADTSMLTVPTIGYRDNGFMRILNWASFAAGAIARGIVSPRPDVVYASSPHLLTGVAGWVLSRVQRAKFILEIRDLWPEVLVAMERLDERSMVYRLLSKLEGWLYRSADHIVVLAQGAKDAIVARGVAVDKISMIPNGAEIADFVAPEPRDVLRERFDLTGTVFVYAGAHGPANGLDHALEAAEEVQEAMPEVLLLLVGDGPSKQELIGEAKKRNLTNVKFMDPIPKREMPALLAAADVGLHVLADVPLFRYGVSPNKVFDYMAAGLPVLTNVPGEVSDLIETAKAGLTTGPSDLASGIKAMATASQSQRRHWGESGRAYIGRYRSRSMLASELEAILDDVLAS